MCTVSMIGDHYRDTWYPTGPAGNIPQWPNGIPASGPSQAEFDELKRQVEEMKELLKRVKTYDEEHNEPECEIDEKMEVLRRVANLVGVTIDDVIGKQ